ncbi:1778_t:CDS:2, partial [Entrophospora sp. SA101]
KAIYVDEDDEELIEDELSEELRLPDQQFRTTTIFHFQIEQLENSKSKHFPSAKANGGGTALPIWRCISLVSSRSL